MIVLAVLTVVMAACSSDDDAATSTTVSEQPQGKVPVRLHLSVAGQDDMSLANTRAWEDPYATSDEMMNIWTVYCVDNNPSSARYGKLVFIHICMPKDDNREIDDLVYLQPGKYAFYTFANIHPISANGLMGISYDPKKLRPVNSDGSLGDEVDFVYDYTDANNPLDFFEISASNPNKGVVYDMKWVESEESDTYVFKYHDIDSESGNDYGMYTQAAVYGLDVFIGNGLDLNATNYFSSKGIPMSNYQEIDIEAGTDVDLIVVRMLAKIELQFFNESNSPITVESATLSDVTQDESGAIFLFPNLNNAGTGHQHEMNYTHRDIRPHVSDEALVGDFTYTPTTAVTVPASYGYETNKSTPAYKMTFYVNESKIPTNPDGLFYLTLKLNGGKELRYSLINQSGKTSIDDNAWNYIARNDYRIIPIVIDDYKLELIPYDFPPIGVYPASVKEIGDNLYEMTFHDYGHFHLVPKVTKISTGATVPFGSATGSETYYWTLNTDFAGSWYTAATKGGAWLTDAQITSNGFYRDQTATVDGDEVGGVPVWYANDGMAGPQWDPAGGTDYNPFIFGYIAAPDGVMSDDKKIYHEFRVQLNGAGASNRVLRYRFYMTLSKDQMLGSRSLTPMPRKRH